MPEPVAYVNGQMIPASTAGVPLTDAGFIWGATVSEHLRTFRFQLFEIERHWRRLGQSLDIAGIAAPQPLAELAFVAEEVVRHNAALLSPGDDLGLIVAITPGNSPIFSRALVSDSAVENVALGKPQIFMHTYPLPFHLWAKNYRSGVRLRIAPQLQVSSQSWPAELKCRSRMHYFLADRWAADTEPGSRALLLDADGYANETSTANIVAVMGKWLISPRREKILPGVSLAVAEELAAVCGLSFEERDLLPAQLFKADEIFLTSTPWCMMPVVAVDGCAISNGQPGVVYGQLLHTWAKRVGIDILFQADAAR